MKYAQENDNWKPMTIRLKHDYINLCDYLEKIHGNKINMERNDFFDMLFRYSLKFLETKGFHFQIEPYNAIRKPKGFSVRKDTANHMILCYDFYSKLFHKMYNRKLYKAEFAELLIYIYAINHLKDYEFMSLDINLGIKKLCQ